MNEKQREELRKLGEETTAEEKRLFEEYKKENGFDSSFARVEPTFPKMKEYKKQTYKRLMEIIN